MNTVAILGAAGRVGEAAALAFLARGWTVRGIARGVKAAHLPDGMEHVQADAFDRAALAKACAGADVIVNALQPPYWQWEDKVLAMAENVIAAAEATGATHMLPGNVYNFGHGIGMDTAEDAPFVPSTRKAEIRIEMEAMFRRKAEEKGVRTIIVRAGDFYGGHQPGTYHDLMILAKLDKGLFVWPGPMNLPHAFAYLPDLGRAFAELAEHRDGFGSFEVFHFAGHTLTGHDMKAMVETIIGRRLKRRGVPWALLRVAGLVMPLMREIAIMSYLWRTPHSLDGSRFKTVVTDFSVTPPEQALRETIAAQRLWRTRETANRAGSKIGSSSPSVAQMPPDRA